MFKYTSSGDKPTRNVQDFLCVIWTPLSLGGFPRVLCDVDGRGMLLSVMRVRRSHDAIGVSEGETIYKTAFSG